MFMSTVLSVISKFLKTMYSKRLGIIDHPILRGLPKYRKFYTRRYHYHELRPYIFIFFSRGYFRWFHPNALKRINIHRIFHQSQTEPVWIEWEHLFLVYLDMVGSSPVFSHFHSKCNCCRLIWLGATVNGFLWKISYV